MTDSYLQPQEEKPFLLQIINHLARQQTALGSIIGNAAGVPDNAKREGWDDATSEPEDSPLAQHATSVVKGVARLARRFVHLQ